MKKTAKQVAMEVLYKVSQINQVKPLPRKTRNTKVPFSNPSTPNTGEPV